MATDRKKKYAPKEGGSAEDRALDKFAELIIEKIKSINEDWKKPWFSENAMQWPRNLNGRDYNGMNALLLMLHSEKQGYKMPVYMTFNSMESLNYTKGKLSERKPLTDAEGNKLPSVMILKGEKSFPVFLTTFTVINKETKEKIKYDDYNQLSNEEKKEYNVYPKLQVYNVFNVDQSNMKEVRPELYNKLKAKNNLIPPEISPDAYSFPAIDEMIKNNEWLCPIKIQHQDEAYYSISKDEIVLPEKQQFYKAENFYGTAFHEMVHSTGAKDRLDRFAEGAYFGSKEYAREELVAELGSALIMQKYGLTKTIKEDSCSYLKSWLDSLKTSPEFLKTVLGDVKKATALLNEQIEKMNLKLSNENSNKNQQELLPVTRIPEDAKVEITTTDYESKEALIKVLRDNIYSPGSNIPIEVSSGTVNSIIVNTNDCDKVAEIIYSNIDAETVSKITAISNIYNGQRLIEQGLLAHNEFSKVFETRRNDQNWLKEQGLEGDIKWDLGFVNGNSGYHIVVAETEKGKMYAVLDHKADIFYPFTEINNVKSGIDGELKERLLSEGKNIDSFGRIKPVGDVIKLNEAGAVQRNLLIDGEAEAVYSYFPGDDLTTPKLELKADKDLLAQSMINPKLLKLDNIDTLLEIKDSIYPPRVIKENTNLKLDEYINSLNTSAKVPEEKTENERKEIPLTMGLHLFNRDDKWGVRDKEGKVLLTPIWDYTLSNNNTLNISRTDSKGNIVNQSYTEEQLENLAQKLSRITDIHIERRGENEDKWIGGEIDDEPVISERLTGKDKDDYEKGEISEMMLAIKYFAAYLNHEQSKEQANGLKM